MKVILLKDVKSQGKKDEIINVSDGYANNYLIKNNLAVPYTKTSKEVLDKELKKQAEIENNLVQELEKIKDKLANKTIDFKVKTGKEDKVFGTISTKQISDKLMEMGFKIDKKCIKIKDPISNLGVTVVDVELHKKVKFSLKINLVK